MSMISGVFNDPIMQSMVFGPLAGILFAVIFAGLTNTPPPQDRTTVRITKNVFVKKVFVNHNRSASAKRGSDDGGGILVGLGALLIYMIWGYAQYEPQILCYTTSALLTVLAFSCTTAAISLIKGQFSSTDWFGYILPPLIVLAACMYLLSLAGDAFSPDFVSAAKATNFVDFYFHVLKDYGRRLLVTQILGMIVLVAIIAITSVAVVHYLSLMNQRSGGPLNGLWSYLVRKTLFFGGVGWQLACLVLLVGAYVALDPELLTAWIARE